MGLYYKHKAFVEEYFKTGPNRFNATKAYQAVYDVDDESAAASASRLLRNVNVRDEIEKRLKELQMSADEALVLMADIARGDIADIMEVTSMGWVLDMQKAQERGKTHLIKKVKQTTTTKIGRKQDDDDEERTYLEVELYPADAALDKILRVHGKYKDVGSEENPHIVLIKKVGVDADEL